MVEVYDAHEQGEVVKNWLKDNGGAIVMGLVLAFGGLFGFKQWQSWQVTNKQQASTEYQIMGQLLEEDRLDEAVGNFQVLQDEYGKSPYAAMASLLMAKARIEANQPELALGLYEDVMNKGYPQALATVGRMRLARLQLDQGMPDEALKTLDGATTTAGFETRFAEVRGDIHFDKGNMDEALANYIQAIEQLGAGEGDRNRLVLKIESMGGVVPGSENES